MPSSSPSSPSEHPEGQPSAPLSGSSAGASPADTSIDAVPGPDHEPEERPGTVLIILLVVANVLFMLLIGPVHGLTALNQDISEFNGEDAGSEWFLFWPGMLIVWGAAWLGFLIFALKNQARSALITFNLVAAIWLLPVALYVVTIIAGA